MIKLLMVGSDPEFFILSNEGKPIPSFLFFRGTKHEPEEVGNGFGILKDNLLVEGNIPPASNKEEFIDNMMFLKELIQIALNPSDSVLFSHDIQEFEEMWILTPDGQEFGCSKFKNAYTKKTLSSPMLVGNKRQAGFHIHMSYDLNKQCPYTSMEMNGLIAKAMDIFLGMPSDEILFTKERRESYGILGAYRDTIYGLEYRSLGGYFTHDAYLPWVYEQTTKAIEFCKEVKNLNYLNELKSADKKVYAELGISLEEQTPVKLTTLD